jgi:hypothetical protein
MPHSFVSCAKGRADPLGPRGTPRPALPSKNQVSAIAKRPTTDPTSFVSVPLVLAFVALVTCYLPARRASASAFGSSRRLGAGAPTRLPKHRRILDYFHDSVRESDST